MILRRQPWSLWTFLGFVVAVGAIVGHLWDGLGLAGFLLFISSIDGKPAWKWFYDAPGNQDSGRDGARFAELAACAAAVAARAAAHASARLEPRH